MFNRPSHSRWYATNYNKRGMPVVLSIANGKGWWHTRGGKNDHPSNLNWSTPPGAESGFTEVTEEQAKHIIRGR